MFYLLKGYYMEKFILVTPTLRVGGLLLRRVIVLRSAFEGFIAKAPGLIMYRRPD